MTALAAEALRRYQAVHLAWRSARRRLENMEQEFNNAVRHVALAEERAARRNDLAFARLPHAARAGAQAWLAKINRRPYDANVGDAYARPGPTLQKKRRPR